MSVIFNTRGQEFFKGTAGNYTLVGEIKFAEGLESRINARFGIGGDFQRFWDGMLLKDIQPYVPFLSGTLSRSAIIHTVIGGGELVWATPYARRQYYENPGPEKPRATGPLRGQRWAERAANDKMPEWEKAAQDWVDKRGG